MIGEAGPEAVVPLSRGGYGGTTVVVNVRNAVVGNEQQLARVVTRAVDTATTSGGVRRRSIGGLRAAGARAALGY